MRWVSVVQVSVVAIAATATFALVSNPRVEGQAARTGGIPRLNGKPDLNGLWQAMNSANYDIQAHTAKAALQMRPGPVVPVPAKEILAMGAVGSVPSGAGVVEGDELPYTADGLKKKQENAANWMTRDPEVKCYLPGVPRITYMPYPFQIVQQGDRIAILYEYLHAVRYLHMNGNPHPRGPIEWWMGDSRGRWEGNTLVVDVIHFNDLTWFDRAGNFHSNALHVVERYTRTGPDHMLYEATIEDPKVFSRPWTRLFVQSPHRVAGAIVKCLRRPRAEVWTSFTVRAVAAALTFSPTFLDFVMRSAMKKDRG